MKGWLAKFGAVVIAGAVLGLALEAALRVFWPEMFPEHERGLYARDPDLGHVLARSRTVEIVRPEYRVSVHTNSEGFRGPELPAKTGRTIRIVCLGDWLTWGEGVGEDETYPARLEATLRRRFPQRDIQVVNAGLPQYSTLDELAYLESFAAEIEPDIVVLQFYAGDDFEQNAIPARERYEIRDDRLIERASFRDTTGPRWLVLLSRAKHASHAVHWLSERAGDLALRWNLMARLERPSSIHFTDAEARNAQALLAEIEGVAAAQGARTLFLFSPEKMQVFARPPLPLAAAEVVAEVAEQTGSAFVDLSAALMAPGVAEETYYDTVGTWRPRGYEIAADAVAAELIARGWIDGAP